jgi:nitrous oxide reductase accessory protein NosL
MRRRDFLAALVTALALAGCQEPDDAKPQAAVRLSEASMLRANTSRAAVLRRIGAAYTGEAPPKAISHVSWCYRWRLEPEGGGRPDPRTDVRLCFDSRDRLSVLMTAPRRVASRP